MPSSINDLLARLKTGLGNEAVMADVRSQLRQEYESVVLRLDRCRSLLRSGHRSEALRQAELPPPLLEQATALMHPAWAPVLQAASGDEPWPVLDQEALRELNEAYVTEQQMAGLLRDHRRLALGRASLAERLTVVRTLKGLDPANPLWHIHAQAMEQALLVQVEAEISRAARDGNLRLLKGLSELLASPDWTVPVPAHVVEAAQQAFRGVARRQLETSLGGQIDAIERMIARGDGERALTLIAETRSHIDQAQFSLPAALQAQWQRILDFERRERQARLLEQQRRVVLQELQKAVKDGADLSDIERLLRRAQQLGATVPEGIREQYEVLVALRRRQRRIVAGFGALMAIFALVLGAMWWMQVEQLHQAEAAVREAIAIGQERLAQGNIESASAAIRGVDSAASRLPTDAVLRNELHELERKVEAARQQRQRFLVTLAKLDQGGPAVREQDWDAAESLAMTDDERQLVQTKKQAWLDARQAAEQAAIAKCQRLMASHQHVLRELQEQCRYVLQASVIERLFTQAAEPYRALENQPALPDHERARLQAAIQELRTLHNQLQVQAQRFPEMADSLQQMVQMYGKPSEYLLAMANFGRQFPASSWSQDFSSTLALREQHQQLIRWSQLQELALKATGDQVSALRATAKALADTLPPDSNLRTGFQSLTALLSIVPDGAPARHPFMEFFSQSFMTGLMVYREEDRIYFTFKEKALEVSAKELPPYYVRFIANNAELMGGVAPSLKSSKYDATRKPSFEPSPLTQISARAMVLLAEPTLKACIWAPWLIGGEILQLKTAPPQLKCFLLRAVLPTTDIGTFLDPETGSRIAAFRKQLESIPIDAWINPESDIYRQTHARAIEILRQAPDVQAVADALWRKYLQFVSSLQITWTGIVWADEMGRRHLLFVDRAYHGEVDMFILATQGRNQVGIDLLPADATVRQQAIKSYPLGTPIYARRKP